MYKSFKLSILMIIMLAISSQSLAVELKTAAQDSTPKYFLNKDDIMNGLCVDIIRAIERVDPGIKFKGYNKFLPFKRIAKKLEIGELDVFFGFVKNKSREEKFVFIEPPLYKVNHVVAVRINDHVQVKSFEDIRSLGKNGKILTIFGTSTARYLEKQGGLLFDDGGKTIPSVLKKLQVKRGRFAYYHHLGLVASINNGDLGNKVKILPVSFREYFHYVAFSKKKSNQSIIKVKTALEKLKKNGELDRIFSIYSTIKQ